MVYVCCDKRLFVPDSSQATAAGSSCQLRLQPRFRLRLQYLHQPTSNENNMSVSALSERSAAATTLKVLSISPALWPPPVFSYFAVLPITPRSFTPFNLQMNFHAREILLQ